MGRFEPLRPSATNRTVDGRSADLEIDAVKRKCNPENRSLPPAVAAPEPSLSTLADNNDFSSPSFQVGLDPPVDVTGPVAIEKHLDTEVGHERHRLVAVETFPPVVWHPYDVRDPDAKRPGRNGYGHCGEMTHVLGQVAVDICEHYLAPGRRRSIQNSLAAFVPLIAVTPDKFCIRSQTMPGCEQFETVQKSRRGPKVSAVQ